jgi:hypothetical protein
MYRTLLPFLTHSVNNGWLSLAAPGLAPHIDRPGKTLQKDDHEAQIQDHGRQ